MISQSKRQPCVAVALAVRRVPILANGRSLAGAVAGLYWLFLYLFSAPARLWPFRYKVIITAHSFRVFLPLFIGLPKEPDSAKPKFLV